MSVRWIFDPAPPSGKRTGGNAAEYSFEGRIDTLVREVVQNSLDAGRAGDEPVIVTFRLIELTGKHLDRFLSGLDWSSVEDNLRAIPEGRGGRGIRRAIEQMTTDGRLRILVIEDHGTCGLEGEEQRRNDEERNSFCALVRDDLYSDKPGTDSGGSFGLGKSVLWAYSGLKTALFASIPLNPPDGRSGIRVIGRTSLPYHETESDGACTGDGWLGIARASGSASRAESVWGAEAAEIAGLCCCSRDADDFGLSAVVVGFTEPGEEDRSLEELASGIREAALESFWPAIARSRLRIDVCREEDGQVLDHVVVNPAEHAAYRPAVELLHDFDANRLQERQHLEVGQASVVHVDIEVPQRTEPVAHPRFRGCVAVLVRLLEDREEFSLIRDRIFRFRGPGMVVRSEGGRNLSIAARPYVAAVLAGRAVGDSSEHERVERFLRAAEPPAHDKWTHNTRMLKQEYQVHGCRAMLMRFDEAIREAIRGLVAQPEEKGGALPKSLLDHLRFGEHGGGGSRRFLSVTQPEARSDGRTWTFRATCRRIRREEGPWHVRVRLKYAVDGGGGDDVHAVSAIAAEGAIRTEVRRGVGYIEFPENVERVRISGRTDADALPAIGTRAAVQLRIDGAQGGIPDA